MSNNVIHVEFGKKNVDDVQSQEVSPNWGDLIAYLNYLREEGIDEEDVLDVASAIGDLNFYTNTDDEVRMLADTWFHEIM